jgi:ribosomal protein L34E
MNKLLKRARARSSGRREWRTPGGTVVVFDHARRWRAGRLGVSARVPTSEVPALLKRCTDA